MADLQTLNELKNIETVSSAIISEEQQKVLD
jgi:hypothetical protein